MKNASPNFSLVTILPIWKKLYTLTFNYEWRGSRLKVNYFGIAAAVLALVSLALSWFSVTMTAYGASINMQFTAFLYQIHGTVNGVSASAFPNVWFVWGALVLMMAVAAGCFAGSFLAGRKELLLLLTTGILALLALLVFGAGLLSSNYANSNFEPASVMGLFSSNAFGLTANNAMQYGYDFVWYFSYGFWLAIGAAIMAFVGTAAPALMAKKTVSPAGEPKTA
jgi:hypothetical protein